ncbi:hypothetical protein BVC80_1797g18 [Macleaya cordata]|uniref:Pentatricopeptide repeat n=1 Tax=Macleaya cordata TaxID=56857 RepID=A0A200PT18_MACCD|nr:hypothetical protein BVC80_1797g18 [Macleaya cordata]
MALINFLLLLLPTRLKASQTFLLHHHHHLFPLILRPLILHPLLPSSSPSSSFPHSYSSSATHPSLLSSSYSSQETTIHFPKHFSLSSLKPSLHQNFSEDPTDIDFQFEAEEGDDTYKKPNEPDNHLFIKILSQAKQFPSEVDALVFLDESLSSVRPTEALVCSAIWALRNEWELGFLAFKWGDKWGCCNSARAWDLMIWVLGKQRRFGVAWRLLRKMIRSSMDSRRSLLLMIER